MIIKIAESHRQAAAEDAQPAEPAARVAAAAVPGGVGGSSHGVTWQPTVSSAIPAGALDSADTAS